MVLRVVVRSNTLCPCTSITRNLQTNRREDAGAEKRIAVEGVEERIFGTGNIGMNPLLDFIRQLLYCEFANGSLFAFASTF
jgi:hypothetical protein